MHHMDCFSAGAHRVTMSQSCAQPSRLHHRPCHRRTAHTACTIDAPRRAGNHDTTTIGSREVVMRSTLPLFPTDDGWPYPDEANRELTADAPDLDAEYHTAADRMTVEYRRVLHDILSEGATS